MKNGFVTKVLCDEKHKNIEENIDELKSSFKEIKENDLVHINDGIMALRDDMIEIKRDRKIFYGAIVSIAIPVILMLLSWAINLV